MVAAYPAEQTGQEGVVDRTSGSPARCFQVVERYVEGIQPITRSAASHRGGMGCIWRCQHAPQRHREFNGFARRSDGVADKPASEADGLAKGIGRSTDDLACQPVCQEPFW